MRLSRFFVRSGRPGSNRRPSAWEAETKRRSPVASGSVLSHQDGRFSRQRGSRLFRLSRSVCVAMFGVCSAFAVLGSGSTYAYAAPCAKHSATTKVTKGECLKAHKTQAKRNAVRWPAYPVTTRDLKSRGVQIQRWVRLGRCEAGHGSGYGGVRWNTPGGWRWQGGLGLYDRSHASTGHPYGYDAGRWNWQTQVLVGHRLMEKYSIRAWSAWRCW
jgi:nitrite reductase/ring-hydroxylating ferredoxin subunit